MERLSTDDLMMLYPDDLGMPMHIGALLILEGDRLLDDGELQLEFIRKHVEQRLPLLPRFRQVIIRPSFGLGSPVWIDAQSFDIKHHVRARPLKSPNEDEVISVCEELRRQSFDPSHPPWEMWFFTGLSDRRVGLFMKIHHAAADGASGVAALASLLDLSSDQPQVPSHSWEPAPGPTPKELLKDNLQMRLRGARRKASHLLHPVKSLRTARLQLRSLRDIFALGRAPRSSLNRQPGRDRRLAIVRGDLEMFKQVGHRYEAKVNDVLLTVVAEGLKELLGSRGEPIDGVILRAMVPVALHHGTAAQGNRDSGVVVPIPIGDMDRARRLESIATDTAERKARPHYPLSTIFHSKLAMKSFSRFLKHQRMVNLYVSNVAGPPMPLYFAGSRLLEIFPFIPIGGNLTLGVAAMSYAGQFNITAIGDRELCPDLKVFIAGVEKSLAALESMALGVETTASGRSAL